jgi:hypothetical protein
LWPGKIQDELFEQEVLSTLWRRPLEIRCRVTHPPQCIETSPDYLENIISLLSEFGLSGERLLPTTDYLK